MISPKATKYNQQNLKHLGQKTIRDLEHGCHKQAHEFLFRLLLSKNILPRFILSSWSVIWFLRSISHYWILEWIGATSEILLRRQIQYIIHYTLQHLQPQVLHCPFTKQFCISLCKAKGILLAKWVAGANPHLSIWFYKLLNFGTAMIIQVLHLFIYTIAQKHAFFNPLQFIQPLNLLVKHFGAHCCSNFPCFAQLYATFYTKKFVLCVCIFLEDEKDIPEYSYWYKLPSLL